MGGKKLIGVVLLILGAAVLVVSALADVLGYGVSPVFGYMQIAGTVCGGLAIIIGITLALRKPAAES